MPLRITLEMFGETEMDRELLGFSERARNMRPVWSEIHQDFMDIERFQFESQGSLSGGWAPLKQSTINAKERAGFDTRIMFRTGALFDSLTESGDENHVVHITADTLRIGSSVGYGVYHQSRAERKHLVRRPLVVLTPAVKKAWVKMIQRWIVHGVIK